MMRYSPINVGAAFLAVAIAATLALADEGGKYKHVFMFSVDGLHASDVPKYLKLRPTSTFAELLSHGHEYTNAWTSAPSDSFPGTLAQITGASPRTTGVWYDDTYDRTYFDPTNTNCTGPPGAEVVYDESIDFNDTLLFTSINPANLPRTIIDGKCVGVYPHSRPRVNTIYELVNKLKGLTCYCDKHPAYDLVRGPSGSGLTEGYFPEIAAASATNVSAVTAYDSLHLQAFLNWTANESVVYPGKKLGGIPSLMGGNFQSVSVVQKTKGYSNESGFPFTPDLLTAIDFVDASIGKIVAEMKKQSIYNDTLIIICSKHGQAPINPELFSEIDPSAVVNATGVPVAFATTDDIALLFLENPADSRKAALGLLANKAALKIHKLIRGAKLTAAGFGDPATDPAVPDIIVEPTKGVIYTTSKSKIEEHGGLSKDDRNVALIVSSPGLEKKTIDDFVTTTQVAVTVLDALGIDAGQLQGAVKEKTKALPGII